VALAVGGDLDVEAGVEEFAGAELPECDDRVVEHLEVVSLRCGLTSLSGHEGLLTQCSLRSGCLPISA